MKGKHKIIIRNNKLHYELEVKRNITIVQGDSATGKTTLIDMLRQNMNLGADSGIDIICDVPCRVLEGVDWKNTLSGLSGNILFTDEGNKFVGTEEFTTAVKGSDNYFVLITRENLYNLPYSVDEIYGIHTSGRYNDTKQIYQEFYKIYGNNDSDMLPVRPEKIITEDSNSGYDFFRNVCGEKAILCESAGGKSNIFSVLKKSGNEETCVIADGAAIGPEMERLYGYARRRKNIKLYLPESFEWLILKSGLIKSSDIEEILAAPEEYIEAKEYFSWEQYFTKLLVSKTEGTFLQYRKSKLNPVFLHEKNKQAVLKVIQGIEFSK